MGARLYGGDLTTTGSTAGANSYPNSPYLGLMSDSGQYSASSLSGMHSNQQQQSAYSSNGYPFYGGPSSPSHPPSSPRPGYRSVNQHSGTPTHHSHPGTPHHHSTGSSAYDPNNHRPNGYSHNSYPYGNSNGTGQSYSSPDVVQSMTNLSLGTSAVEGGVGNGASGMPWEQPTGAQLYQMEHSTTSSRYRKMFIGGDSFGESSCNGRSPGHPKGQPEHYPNAYTTPDAMYMYGPKQYPMDPNQLQSPNLQALNLYSNTGDRRLSDSAYSRNFTKADADSFREDQLKAVQSVSSSPKGYSNSNCQCANCQSRSGTVSGGKPHRPKVSFGPSMMYPMSPYDGSNYPGGSFGGSGAGSPNDLNDPKSKANAPPWSKLTTELLPLDTQIPLQMMSDNALVCNIL